MENLPGPVETITIPVVILVPEYLRDHLVAGRAILPAVEALQTLARTLPAVAAADLCRQEQGGFGHLLPIDPQLHEIMAIHELTLHADGSCRSRLVTVLSSRQAGWTRRIEHASVFFMAGSAGKKGQADGSPTVFDEKMALSGPVFTFSPRRLYADLVPFGPAYRNVAGDVRLTTAGGSARVFGGNFQEAVGPLGSPFPLDAAMHVACAWGQRYKNRVAFPVGFRGREILVPTRAGETYRCDVTPLREENPAILRFDIRLYAEDRQPVEVIRGLEMREISGGRRKPPVWVRET